MWKPEKYQTFDFETSGAKKEYALQPWRVAQGLAWPTSFVSMRVVNDKPVYGGGLLDSSADPYDPVRTKHMLKVFLEEALHAKRTLIGWKVEFDIAWLMACGLEDLALQCKYMDGMLLWKHCCIEPEYETARAHRQSFGLKEFVRQFIPERAGYETEIDFHDPTPEARRALHKYNKEDNLYTYIGAKHFYELLEPQQRVAAKIEACMLPLVARSNLRGFIDDTLASRDLACKLVTDAEQEIEKLQWAGVTETIVRSPAKLANLVFDTWKLPVLKLNKSKQTGNTTRSTDKEVLHELSFLDERAKWLRRYREALNNKTKFADALIASATYNGDNRCHPQAIPFGTYTGRLTYSSNQAGKGPGARKGTEKKILLPTGFALHQMKGIRAKYDEMYRSQIIAPPDHKLLEFDAAGQEFRWMAIQSGDETMLQLCLPGEDPHSYMGARIIDVDYEQMKLLKEIDKAMKNGRKLGKVANLCVVEGTTILTDRGPCSIEDVHQDDLVWDGEDFVSHDGLSFSGVRDVLTHQGVSATPEHQVLVSGDWRSLDEAQRMAWSIDRACTARSAVRIVGGLARRAVRKVWRDLCESAVRLWCREGDQLAHVGGRSLDAVQSMSGAQPSQAGGQADLRDSRGQAATEAGERLVSAVQKPQEPVVSGLRRAWDRVQIWVGPRSGGLRQGSAVAPHLSEVGHRPQRQRWSLRAWKLALGYTEGEPSQSPARTYDIVNCGPRHRFSANGLIVHNSLQFRTYPKRLCSVARVQYDIPMVLPEAELIWLTYQRTYRRVPTYWQKSISKVKRLGYAETLAGRRVQVTGDWSGRDGWSMEGTAINFPIQGTGGDQKCLAIACIADYLPSVGAHFGWDLHDGVYVFVPSSKAQQAGRDIKHILDNLPYERAWGFTPPIPLPWDAKIGDSWGDLKEFKFD